MKVRPPIRPVARVYPPLDLAGKHRIEAVPPETYRLMADVDAALEQQIFDLSYRQRVPSIHHQREADDLWRNVEIGEGISHLIKL